MDSRVGQLDLTVRAPEARWARLREPSEQFAKKVLARCDELLEELAPGRVVLLRELDMHWRVLENAFERKVEVTAFARELADAIDDRAREAPTQPSASRDIVVFESEIAWRSAHLVANAKRTESDSWYFARLNAEGEVPGGLTRVENRSMAVAVVLHLARSGALAEVLEGLSGSAVVAISRVILGDFEESRVSKYDSFPSLLSPRRLAIERIVLFSSDVARTAASSPPSANPSPSPSLEIIPGLGFVDERVPVSGRHGNLLSDEASWSTRFGGLFYLLNPALELSVGEILWKACVHEGAILSRAALAILGPSGADDVAPELFGGVPPAAPTAPISVEAHREITLALFENLIRALTRRDMATLPEVTVTTTGCRGRRMLIVTPSGTDFVLFALPAETPVEASSAIAAFLGRWPLWAERPVVSLVLAELDSSGRLIAGRELRTTRLLTSDTPDALTRALVAQVAGAIAYLFVARVGTLSASELLEALIVDARIRTQYETMTVDLPERRVSLAVRRAGLDMDPGQVPWLKLNVLLKFAAEASDSSLVE